jgi:hypothetical protein
VQASPAQVVAGSGRGVAAQWRDVCRSCAFGLDAALAPLFAGATDTGTLCAKFQAALGTDQAIVDECARAGSARACNRSSAGDPGHCRGDTAG